MSGGTLACRVLALREDHVMKLTVALLLLLAAFVTAIVSAMNKCPVWVSVVLLCVLELIDRLPKN